MNVRVVAPAVKLPQAFTLGRKVKRLAHLERQSWRGLLGSDGVSFFIHNANFGHWPSFNQCLLGMNGGWPEQA